MSFSFVSFGGVFPVEKRKAKDLDAGVKDRWNKYNNSYYLIQKNNRAATFMEVKRRMPRHHS